MLYELYEVFTEIKEKSYNKKYIAVFFVIGITMVIGLVVLISPDDVSFGLKIEDRSFLHHELFLNTVVNTFLVPLDSKIVKSVLTVCLLAFAFVYFKGNRVKAGIYLVPSLIYLGCIFSYNRHLTNLFVLVMAVMILFKPDKKQLKKSRKILITSVITVILAINCVSAVYSLTYDYKNAFSSAEETAEFVKDYVEQDKKISTVGYCSTAIQPYFDKNIFFNHPGDKAYYYWSENNNYFLITPDNTYGSDVIVCEGDSNMVFQGYKKNTFKANVVFKLDLFESSKSYSIMTVYTRE